MTTQTAHLWFKASPFGTGHRYLIVETLGPKWVTLRCAASLQREKFKRADFDKALVKMLDAITSQKFWDRLQANIARAKQRKVEEPTPEIVAYDGDEAELTKTVAKWRAEQPQTDTFGGFINALPQEVDDL